MNTVLLLPALFASDGGIERILRLYVRAFGELAPHGTRVETIVLNDRVIAAAQLTPYATPALTAPIGCGRNKLACAWHVLRRTRAAGRVICGHINLLRLAHLARRLKPALEIWLVAHGMEVWRDFTPAERRALADTQRILCVSDFTRREILARCPELDATRVCVQPNALDPQFAPQPSARERGATEPGLILSVARLNAQEAYKGIDHLIHALPAVRAAIPSAHLRIIGDGTDRARLESIAGESDGKRGVEFAGRVTDDELRAQFSRCELFALPSRGEGFGLVYLEAMAHGKPCLAANSGGAPEVVDDSCGALVPYGDVTAVARAAVAALQRKWDPAALQARAREFSYEAFRHRLAERLHHA